MNPRAGGHPHAGEFDVCGVLPTGVTVLEASAGTGKTFAIAALAARYVAGGMPLDALLLVTFTRMATGELRERVRERLVTTEQGLARAGAGASPDDRGDEILALLASGTPGEVETRRRNLAAALANFDAATIATTHGFCQHILTGLGVAGDVEGDISFLEDPTDLVHEVVDDLYVLRFHRSPEAPPFDLAEARRIGRKVIANPLAPLEPTDAPEDTAFAMRRRLACAVRAEVERRKRRGKLLTYDDLLTRLLQTLRHPTRGAAACRRLRERYQVALVDEFQDTDPVQWEIMQRAFGQAPSTLVLIGDPKQAIYAFRGADVYAYLTARDDADTTATLGTNWRSDQGLIDAYDALFAGTSLGHAGITYRTVRAVDANQKPRLHGAPVAAPLRVRVVDRASGFVELTSTGCVTKPSGEAHVAEDLAGDVVALLEARATVLARDSEGAETGREVVRPGHLAVLVRTNKQAGLVRDALDAVGVPAVINGAGSVFATPVARQWLALLQALERPTSPARARAAALTSFLGWTVAEVALTDDAAWEDVHARLHRWAGVLRRAGVASLLERITRGEGLPGRVLARIDGERALTDLRHVGQLLHAQATAERLGITALTAWLSRRIAEADADTPAEDRSRRLESDAEAVQVLTVHRSKGLEFPIVYCPFLWQPGLTPEDEPAIFHDPGNHDVRTIDVGMGGPGWDDHRRLHLTEQRGEDLRLAYVALTRARHQAVVWWAGSYEAHHSPLGRLLFDRFPDGTVAAEGAVHVDDGAAFDRFTALADAAPGCVSVEPTIRPAGRRWRGERAPDAEFTVCRFDRAVDDGWRRTSYSAITADAYEPRVATEADDPRVTDEPLHDGAPAAGATGARAADGTEAARAAGAPEEARLRATACPLASMPGGTTVGSLVHAVLEATDFAAPDLEAELTVHVGEQRRWSRIEIGDPATLVAGLRDAIDTPLGPLLDDVALRAVTPADRLDELDFELPLAGGDAPGRPPMGSDTPERTPIVTVAAIGALLRHHLPAGDVLAGYADHLDDPVLARELRGYLAGSIDCVLRLHAPGGTPRFAVVDYKTNWLGVDGEDLTAWHYRPAALTEAMVHGHYPLQALLYSVALHRYLRWRLPGYTPERNLAGIAYLFVRGMTGPDVPRVGGQPCGVFAWQPPPALVEGLSDLFDRGAP